MVHTEWTLQELLAPEFAIFCTAKWEIIGHKHPYPSSRGASGGPGRTSDGRPLVPALAQQTGISEKYLYKQAEIGDASIAERMSWASRRTTTRIEDQAYCLLGRFDINMPLLYGEGPKAFERLQKEILQTSDGTSIFAFVPMKPADKLLAESPKDFLYCQSVKRGHLTLTEPY